MHSIGARLKAARMLGGFANPDALGKAIGRPRMSGRTLREVETGRRELEDYERAAVADACGIHPTFFDVDLSQPLGEMSTPNPERAAEELLAHALEAARALSREVEQGVEVRGPRDPPAGSAAAGR